MEDLLLMNSLYNFRSVASDYAMITVEQNDDDEDRVEVEWQILQQALEPDVFARDDDVEIEREILIPAKRQRLSEELFDGVWHYVCLYCTQRTWEQSRNNYLGNREINRTSNKIYGFIYTTY